MISTGTMILILGIFIVTIGISFYSGFSIAKKTIQPEIKTVEVKPTEEEYIQPFKDKMMEFLEDMFSKKKKDDGKIKKVVTCDGIAKNDNDCY